MFGKLCICARNTQVAPSPGPLDFLQVFCIFMNISKSYSKTLLICNNEYSRVEIERLSILNKTYNNIKIIVHIRSAVLPFQWPISEHRNKRWFVGKQHCVRDETGKSLIHTFLSKLL